MAINRGGGANRRKGSKPISKGAKARGRERSAKSKPRGKSAKVLPGSARHRRKGRSEESRW